MGSTRRAVLFSVAVMAAVSVFAPADAGAQMAHDRGQNVVPAFEGWEPNP